MAKKAKTRTEHDSMGTMTVPADVLFGASTQRAVLNFPISDRPVGHEVIHAFALLKHAAADTNHELGKLTEKRRRLIVNACKRIAADLDGDVGTPTLLLLDIPDNGGFYVKKGADVASPGALAAFLADPGARNQLSG